MIGFYNLTPSIVMLIFAVVYFLCRPDHWEHNADVGAIRSTWSSGAKSLYIATSRLGVPVEYNNILLRIPFWKDEQALDDLRFFAACSGLRVTQKIISFDELLAVNSPVVLCSANNSFSCADPREVRNGERPTMRKAVRVYELDKPARWLTNAELQSHWHGKALIVDRILHEVPFEGPHLVFGSCWHDIGHWHKAEAPEYTVQCRNEGSAIGTIEVKDMTLGCSSAQLSRHVLRPGETATLTVKTTSTSQEGYWQENVVLSADGSPNDIYVTLCGAVGR
jgi:hypothetical protein